jgi:hypothetical protein
VDGDKISRSALKPRPFAKLRSNLAKAIAANADLMQAAGKKRDNDDQLCKKDQN